ACRERRTGRKLLDTVAVAHPDAELLTVAKTVEDAFGLFDDDFRVAVLARFPAVQLAPVRVRQQLHPIADAEGRQAHLEERLGGLRRRIRADAGGSPGEDNRFRPLRLKLSDGNRVRLYLAVDAETAHRARDELRELRSEIEDDDGRFTHGD